MVKTRGAKPLKPLVEVDLQLLERLEDLELYEMEKAEARIGTHRSTLDASFSSLPLEVLMTIVEFVDDTRDLYNLSMTTKGFRASVTDTAIVRACIFAGSSKDKQQKRTTAILSTLMSKIEQGSIRPPSTFRFLRLLNAKRCEMGDKCFRYNLKTKLSEPLRGSELTNRRFGLALCNACLPNLTSKQSLVPYSTDDPTKSARIAHEKGSYFLHLHREQATGDTVGPYFFAIDVSRINASYKYRVEWAQAVEELVARSDKEMSKVEKERALLLVDMHSMVKADFLAFEERKQILKSDKMLERINLKRERVQVWLSVVEGLLQNYEIKDFVLSGSWDEVSGERNFSNRISNETIGRLLRAPTACTEEKLAKKVNEMKVAYDLIFSNGFGTSNRADFLSFLRGSDASSARAILQYSNFGDDWVQREIACVTYYSCTFAHMIRNSGPLTAFFRHLPCHKMADVFVQYVAPSETDNWRRKLARSVWRVQQPGWNCQSGTPETLLPVFEACISEYVTLRNNLTVYIGLKSVRAFMAETSNPARRSLFFGNITRLSTMNQIFELKHGSRELLQEGKFLELLTLQKFLFLNPIVSPFG